MTPAVDSPVAPGRAGDTAHQRAWYWYDWANSAYVTTTLTVLMAPYLTVIAKKSACPTLPGDVACHTNLSVVGVPVDPGSLVFYVLTFSTILSAIILIVAGRATPRNLSPGGFENVVSDWLAHSGSIAVDLIDLHQSGSGPLSRSREHGEAPRRNTRHA